MTRSSFQTGNQNRISATRAIKNAKFLHDQAKRLLAADEPIQNFTRDIPLRTLGRLHKASDPASLVADPRIKSILERVKFPELTATLTDPLFGGTLFFVQIQFTIRNQNNAVISVSTADIQTAINFATRAAVPISGYAAQYGPNLITVDPNIITFAVTLDDNTYADDQNNPQLAGWINIIASQLNLPSNAFCLVVLNPQGMLNIDADPSQGIGGYHNFANVPYIFVNLFGQNLTVADQQQAYALALSHEMAEMVVDPQANLVNPEVCDPCGPNCQNVFVDYFDGAGAYIATVQASGFPPGPPLFQYSFMINGIVRPASATQCPAPGGDCNYQPALFELDLTGVPGRIALAHQASIDQLDALVVDDNGAVSVLWTVGEGAWQPPLGQPRIELTAPGYAPPGARIALAHQASMNQLDALLVNNNGAAAVLWAVGGGAWQGPVELTAPGFAPPGASVALAHQASMNQLDALLVDNNGAVVVLWAVGEGAWQPPIGQPPVELTAPGFAPPGASIALAHQASMNQLDALLVDSNGAVAVLWAVGEGAWQPPIGQPPIEVTAPGFAPPGASIALAHQASMNQLDALLVDNNGAVAVLWAVGQGEWQPPAELTAPGFAPPGASIALAHQVSMNQLDALLVDNNGAVAVLWTVGEGAWQPPVELTASGFAPPGASIALAHQASMNQLDALLVDNNGAVAVLWAVGEGAWQPRIGQPSIELTAPAFVPPLSENAPVAAWGANRLDLVGRGRDLAVYHKAWNGQMWIPTLLDWERLGGVFIGPPAIASWGPNRLDIFGCGRDLAIYHKAWDGQGWLPDLLDWDRLGGVFTGPPAVVSWGSNRLDLFGRGRDLAMYHKAWDGKKWLPSALDWERLGGVFAGPFAVVSWARDRLDLFGRGRDLAIYHKAWGGKEWLPSLLDWERLGGVFTGPLAAVSWGPGRLDLFGRGRDLAMYHKAWDGKEWLPSLLDWERLGGVFSGPPAAASWASNRLDLFGRGRDLAIYHKAWDGKEWLPSLLDWERLGGVLV
jgi:hypothetical protein